MFHYDFFTQCQHVLYCFNSFLFKTHLFISITQL